MSDFNAKAIVSGGVGIKKICLSVAGLEAKPVVFCYGAGHWHYFLAFNYLGFIEFSSRAEFLSQCDELGLKAEAVSTIAQEENFAARVKAGGGDEKSKTKTVSALG